jgi:hypothetical protein
MEKQRVMTSILDTGCWIMDSGFMEKQRVMTSILDAGFWILDYGCWILDSRKNSER